MRVAGRAMAKFQSAPPAEGEIEVPSIPPANDVLFQSAPPAEARGDEARCLHATRWSVFQSAPPAEARGDGIIVGAVMGAVLFQSAPPAEARGDPDPR